jgi:hypothetical protein
MSRLTEFTKQKIELDEKRKLLLEIQEEMESSGAIPKTPVLYVRNYRKIMEAAGLTLFGILLGQVSVVIVYVIWNLFLHINLNP